MRAPGVSWLVLTLCAGCSFNGSAEVQTGSDTDAGISDPTADASIDPADARWIDAAPCVFDTGAYCEEPGAPFNLTSSFNTDSDPLCRDFTPAGGVDTCLVLVESATQAMITTSVTGTRPLLLVATGQIELAGIFDLSSKRVGQTGAGADFATCAAASAPQNDTGGAAGGAGGSFAGKGGDGGVGDTDTSKGSDGNATAGTAGDAVSPPSFVRGGCPGSVGGHESDSGGDGKGGRPGASGGGVSFVAGVSYALLSGASIRAMGAGGAGGEVQSGGGGGGSGGYVRIEAPTISLQGNISANGGSGGEGGSRVNSSDVSGNNGNDGLMSNNAAPGGSGAPGSCGDGGDGSSKFVTTGQTGDSVIVGAGGGGGSAGFILLKGSVSGSGQRSPEAITLP